MDLLLRNASLIDGSGSAARLADVAVTGDRISAVREPGELEAGPDTEVVDLDGLTLAPGFIDIHTHYDAQILWDGDLTPSSWHGVTSVVMGNCGFAVAPTRPEHRDTIVRTFENVEGTSRSRNVVIEFPSYQAALDCYHSPEYQALIQVRAPAGTADIVIAKGYDGPQPG